MVSTMQFTLTLPKVKIAGFHPVLTVFSCIVNGILISFFPTKGCPGRNLLNLTYYYLKAHRKLMSVFWPEKKVKFSLLNGRVAVIMTNCEWRF